MEKGLSITIGIIIIAIAAIVAGIYFTGGFASSDVTPTTNPNTTGTILFYGRECPHCKNVDDFIAANKIDQKVSFTNSEVWHNKANAQLLSQKAQICGITTDTVGVPFLYDGNNKCLIGEVDVINFFKNAAGIK
jgi:glutaredoxin-related protein